MNIYLDINGTLLKRNLSPAPHLEEFLTKVFQNNTVYWLTTHCKGDASAALQHLEPYIDSKCFELCTKILPTDWKTWKTEAIDMTKEFLWFDDSLMEAEKQALINANKLTSWIHVDLEANPDQLLTFV